MLYKVFEIYYNQGKDSKDLTVTYEKFLKDQEEVQQFIELVYKIKSPQDLYIEPLKREGVA